MRVGVERGERQGAGRKREWRVAWLGVASSGVVGEGSMEWSDPGWEIEDGRSDRGYGRWVVGGVVKRGLGWWNRVWLWGEEAW